MAFCCNKSRRNYDPKHQPCCCFAGGKETSGATVRAAAFTARRFATIAVTSRAVKLTITRTAAGQPVSMALVPITVSAKKTHNK